MSRPTAREGFLDCVTDSTLRWSDGMVSRTARVGRRVVRDQRAVVRRLFRDGSHPRQVSSPNTIEDAGAAPDTGPEDECPTDGAVRECTREHAVSQCQDGGCALVGCVEPYSDCDRKSENGCETALDTPENCGSCGSVCTFQHAGARCRNGACELGACVDHYGNCDDDPDNGCETPLTTLSSKSRRARRGPCFARVRRKARA